MRFELSKLFEPFEILRISKFELHFELQFESRFESKESFDLPFAFQARHRVWASEWPTKKKKIIAKQFQNICNVFQEKKFSRRKHSARNSTKVFIENLLAHAN